MADVAFRVEFRGDAPEPIKVGDRLKIGGYVTVRAIEADAIDIRSYGDTGAEYAMGEVTVSLLSNGLDVSA